MGNKKITAKYCPKCKDELIVKGNDQIEVFECENCKFKVSKKKNEN